MKRQAIVIAAGLSVLLVFALFIYAYKGQQTERTVQATKQSSAALVRFHSPTYGAADAKVELVEFFDPACEACRKFYPLVKEIVDSSGGKVRLVLRYAALHQGSDEAIKILEAARKQQRFWPAVEAALAAQPQWASHSRPQPELIWNYLDGLGLDIERARTDARDPRIAANLEQDRADMVAMNVKATPSFIVNGTPLQDFGVDQLKTLVRREVDKAYQN